MRRDALDVGEVLQEAKGVEDMDQVRREPRIPLLNEAKGLAHA